MLMHHIYWFGHKIASILNIVSEAKQEKQKGTHVHSIWSISLFNDIFKIRLCVTPLANHSKPMPM